MMKSRWACIRAAKEDKLLREKMLEEGNYQTAMQHYLTQSLHVLKKRGDNYPDRELLYDRQGLC